MSDPLNSTELDTLKDVPIDRDLSASTSGVSSPNIEVSKSNTNTEHNTSQEPETEPDTDLNGTNPDLLDIDDLPNAQFVDPKSSESIDSVTGLKDVNFKEEFETESGRIIDPHSIEISRFMEAAQRGDLQTLQKFINDKIVGVNEHLEDKVTALHWASINNRLSVVKYLVSEGAIVDFQGGDLDATPLQWACRYGLVYIADYLINDCNADPSLTDTQGFNCLHLAVHSSNIMMVVYMLYFSDIPIDSPDPRKRTSLHWACYQGDSLSADVLLRLGASPSVTDETGFTPLHWALIRGVKRILIDLLEKGANVNAKTNEGKDSFDVAKDMNCTKTLFLALKESGFNKDGSKKQNFLMINNKKHLQILTYLIPFIWIPIVLNIMSIEILPVILNLLISMGVIILIQFLTVKFVLPSYINESNSILKSPYLAGIFSGTTLWVALSWFFTILPATFKDRPITNIIFLILLIAVVSSFQKAMLIDPGYIPRDTNKNSIKKTIKDLIEIKKFDINNFCINTSIRLPLRSKYSRFGRLVVARFDHYCPWIYNDVGVRNHKLFFTFILSLTFAIITYCKLVLEYFDEYEVTRADKDLDYDGYCSLLGEDSCKGYYNTPYTFYLLSWTMLQLVWLSLVLLSQTFQLLKGLTTYEANNLHRFGVNSDGLTNSSFVPEEFLDRPEQQQQQQQQQQHQGQQQSQGSILGKFLCIPGYLVNSQLSHLTGLDQFIITTREMFNKTSKKLIFNFGMKTNCLDFWFMKSEDENYSLKNLFKLPIEGEADLNGRLVDYYHLYELPSFSRHSVV
ncbi:hypothetical protein BVG19_g1047 [[Candida] boidinii]|nr:hypothetical protein BVG19_g1047 [[Candida] boidinii]OWB50656.1 hypothetical protein B5S27_g2208 [[Candida] boidinii]